MAMVRRRREGIRGFSVNALGFAGSLLSTEVSDRPWIQRSGPEALLQAVVDTQD
jgi:ATP adenylyltransferase